MVEGDDQLRGADVVPLQGAAMVGGEGDDQLLGASVLWCGEGRVTTNFGGVDVVPLLGAIVGCHCSVLWLRGRVTTNFGGVDVVPLLGAIAGCHCSVLWWGKGGLWGSGRCVIAGCHCRVPISVSYLPPIFRATNFTQMPKKTTMNLASCRRYDNTKIGFCYLGSMLV